LPDKIKVFLGAYINFTNSQNLNCLALAKYLDKKKFEVYALEIYFGNLESNIGRIEGVTIFPCFRPLVISRLIAYFWGIFHCDIAYLPKREVFKYNRFLLKVFRKSSFSTIEGILDEKNLASSVDYIGSYENVISAYSMFNYLFPISSFLGKYNSSRHNLKIQSDVLYLGIDHQTFSNTLPSFKRVRNIIFIGRLIERKGVYDFLTLAEHFPILNFCMVGDGIERENLESLIQSKNLSNIRLLGVLNPNDLAETLKSMDLHILPSRSEGFPKVILETAAFGIPSLLYSDYGAAEWIQNNVDGIVVDTLPEMVQSITDLVNDEKKYQELSVNAYKFSQKYLWKNIIPQWEKVIEDIYAHKAV